MEVSRYYTLIKKLRREAVIHSLFFLKEGRRRQLERFLRGKLVAGATISMQRKSLRSATT
jgi:hypothetical protein